MKEQIITWLNTAVAKITNTPMNIQLTPTKDPAHGDFATNVAMMLAKSLQQPPKIVAQQILDQLSPESWIEKVDIAGPGFINIFLKNQNHGKIIEQIFKAGEAFGRGEKKSESMMVEFVSANPTGPLHVGHGRGAAYGATLADLLETAGYNVHREYYVNDAGRQMNILATSIWLRTLELLGESITFPRNGYQGDYVIDIARELMTQQGEILRRSTQQVFADLPEDEVKNAEGEIIAGDKEAYIDALIMRAQTLLGDLYQVVFNAGLNSVLDDIKQDLGEFGVHYQQWFSENSLMTSGHVTKAIEQLKQKGHLYQKENAWWFKSTAFGDDKDRVVLRDNGQPTYFATDIAYHLNKFERGFTHMINIWGADHHGYIPRVKAAIQALGYNPDQLTVLLVQFAILWRGEERVSMSTRSGSFVTLRELRDEVSNDAARYYYASRKCEQHLDFDLELAKSSSKDNPVYYIQYAHARICSMLRKTQEANIVFAREAAPLDLLIEEHELALMKRLAAYPDVIARAAAQYEPHQVANYLRELAGEFHTYYNAHRILVDDYNLCQARLALSLAAQQVLANGLKLMGIGAPEEM